MHEPLVMQWDICSKIQTGQISELDGILLPKHLSLFVSTWNAFCSASQVWAEELGPLLVNSISLVLEEQRETILPLFLILKFLMPEILGIGFITWRNKPIWISNLLFLSSRCICSGRGSYYPLIFQVMEHSNPALEADYQDILSSLQNGSRTSCLVICSTHRIRSLHLSLHTY